MDYEDSDIVVVSGFILILSVLYVFFTQGTNQISAYFLNVILGFFLSAFFVGPIAGLIVRGQSKKFKSASRILVGMGLIIAFIAVTFGKFTPTQLIGNILQTSLTLTLGLLLVNYVRRLAVEIEREL